MSLLMQEFEGQYVAHSQLSKSLLDPTILTIEQVRYHGTKRNLDLHHLAHQFYGDLELGAKLWILLAFLKVVGWGGIPHLGVA